MKKTIEVRFEIDTDDDYTDKPETTEGFIGLARDIIQGLEDLPKKITITCDGVSEDWDT
jgi:hypothetical protein